MKLQGVLAATALALAGCVANPAATTATGEPDRAAGSATSRCEPANLSVDAAESANDAGILRDVRALPNRPPTALTLDVGPGGNVLQELGRRDQRGKSGTTLRPGTLTVENPETGNSRTIRDARDTPSGNQILFGDLGPDHVVWTEQPDTTLTEANWRIYAADRSTGKISTVAKARSLPELGTAPTVPGYSIPTVNHGWVYWPEARSNQTEGQPPVVNVYGRELGSDRPAELVAKNALSPVATTDSLYYIGFDPERWQQSEYKVHRMSLSTGDTSIVDSARGSGRAGFLTARGDTVAWSLGRTVLVFRDTTQVAEVTAARGALMWLRSGTDTITFTQASEDHGTHYLLDLRNGCALYRLGPNKGVGEVHAGGDAVAWTVPGTNDSGQDTGAIVRRYAILGQPR